MPAFPRFKQADTQRILATAAGGGYLTRQGRCLGLATRAGTNFRAVIWPETARLTMDSAGLLLTDSASGTSARIGDYLTV